MSRNINPNSLANLDPKARYQGKKRVNLTLTPETYEYLKQSGNASQSVEDLVNQTKFGKDDQPTNLPPVVTQDSITSLVEQIQVLTEKLSQIEDKPSDSKEINDKVIKALRSILENHNQGIKGYKSNSFGQGIKDLRCLLDESS